MFRSGKDGKMQILFRINRLIILLLTLLPPVQAGQKATLERPPASKPKHLHLNQATICEQVKDRVVQNEAVVFSSNTGRIYCFTDFDSVAEKIYIHHNWYRRDVLMSKVKLSLRPPRWSTFSYITIRETDKGPWRVEITDPTGNILHMVRFSITD